MQNKANLMNELAKMRKVIDREAPGCLKEVLLVLDSTTGQNAISQAKTFGEASGVTGVILTKLDGTAKGGVVIGIRSEFDLPVKLIGTGEQIDDMEYFDAKEFGRALFSGDDDVFQSEAEEFIEDVKEEIAETVADIKEEAAELKADVQIAAEIIKEEAAEYKAETQTLVEEIVEDIKEEAAEWKAEAEEFVADVQEEIADLMDAPQADDLDEYNDVEETEDKPKKKGFFGGLFGGRK